MNIIYFNIDDKLTLSKQLNNQEIEIVLMDSPVGLGILANCLKYHDNVLDEIYKDIIKDYESLLKYPDYGKFRVGLYCYYPETKIVRYGKRILKIK